MPATTREEGVLWRERSQVLRLIALGIAIVAALAVALGATLSAAQAAPVGALKQFRVPTPDSEPRSITNGSDGNRWFVEGNQDSVLESPAIGQITPAGEITEFPVNCSFCSLSDIVQGPEDILYFTSNEAFLGRITTSGVFLAPIPMPETDVLAGELAVHGDDIWITDFNNDSLWRYDTTGQDTGFTQFPVPEPSDVAVDEAGIVWFAATSDKAIGRLDPATGTATLTPTVNLFPRGITVAADGDVWFSARFVPQGVGELDPDTDPNTNDVREFPLTDNPGPQDIAASPDGSVWFTQTTKGNIARITENPDGVGITITEGRVVRNSEPFGITVAPNGDPWYTMLEANKIATLQLR
jgi:virginiamycin B lyase